MRFIYARMVIAITALCLGAGPLSAQSYQPTASNLQAREAFRDHGLGIFLHWGLYSLYAQGEWYLNNPKIKHAEYAKAAAAFYPIQFDARAWVATIKASGAGYLCITSRHHDSFSMWNTKQSDYNIVQATPFGRDILAELRDECRRQGLGFHIYYSILDWAREDYYPLGRTGHDTGRTQHGSWERYDAFMNAQLTELVSEYDADAIWLDGHWDHDIHPGFDWGYERMYANIHRLKPNCLIGNNHHERPKDGEDFQMFERDVPGANSAGLSGQEISTLPLETCQTMNGMWGYKIADQDYKPTSELIRLLVQTAGRNANLLLNVGPEPSGNLPAVAVERLADLGAWMQVYGSTVRGGVRGGPISPQRWGVTTHRGKTVYLHILDWTSRKLSIPLTQPIEYAVVFDSRQSVRYTQSESTTTLKLDAIPSTANPIDYIVEIQLK